MCVLLRRKVFVFAPGLRAPWREQIATVQQVGILVLSGCPLRLALCSPLAPLPFALSLSPRARCQMGSLVLGGALLSRRRPRRDQDAERSQPHIDGCAPLRARRWLRFSRSFNPASFLSPFPFLWTAYAATATWLLRSGSYTSPDIHSRCSSTASFRATATTARFFAFFPPRSQIRRPNRRRSLSAPCGPRM
jgi:hypothetical protein